MAVENELIKGIELLKEGKEEGFNILYSHTYNYVYGRAKVIMKNEDDALDLTQETFVQAYKNISQLEDVNNIYAWLGSITYRQGMKMFRKRREVLVGEDAEGIFEDVEDGDSDYHPEASAEEKATADIMKSLIDELPELQKATIMAYYYDNMKIDAIAEVFECSSNTVKSRLNYAKKFLRTKVEEHEKENRYKLHSLTPAVFLFAFRSIMSGDKYVMSAAMAQGVYDGVCTGVGVTSSSIVVGESGIVTVESTTIVSEAGTAVAESTAMTAETSTTIAAAETVGASVGSSSAAGIGGAVATETVVKTGMGIGMKILLGAATVLTVGAVTVGAMSLGSDSQDAGGNQTQTQEENRQDGQAGTEDELQEERVLKYVTHYEKTTMEESNVVIDMDYEFDENGFISKSIQYVNGEIAEELEIKWETTDDGYIARSYYTDGTLQSVGYYDKNFNSRKSEIYDKQTGNLASEVEYNENSDITKQVTYYPDGSGESKIEYEYDAYGNVTVQRGYTSAGIPNGELKEDVTTYSYDYDENNRVLRRYDDSQSFSTYEYDDANHTVREVADGIVLREWVYDENGTLRSYYIRNLSYEINLIYDEDGYILERTQKQNGEVLYSESYTYTSIGELRAME